jgi:hypothetical protein
LLGLTKGVSRLPPAFARYSLRLPAAADAQRSAAKVFGEVIISGTLAAKSVVLSATIDRVGGRKSEFDFFNWRDREALAVAPLRYMKLKGGDWQREE